MDWKAVEAQQGTNDGTNGNYYSVMCRPIRKGKKPYVAECEDIIEALGMTFDEGNVLKSLWRMCAARLGNGKAGHSPLYDAQKVAHYGKRIQIVHEREAL